MPKVTGVNESMKKCTTYTIGKTIVTKEYDPNPDTSFLGEYGNTYKPGCIIRSDETFYEDHIDDEEYEPGTMHREYSFFYPPDNGEKPGSPDYKKYALQDYHNFEEYNNSHWAFVIVRVTTHIYTDTGIHDTVFNTLSGVYDHFDKKSREYMEHDVIPDLVSLNTHELKNMGFSDDEIKESMDHLEYGKEW